MSLHVVVPHKDTLCCIAEAPPRRRWAISIVKDFGAVSGVAGAGSGTRPGAQVVASFAEGRIGYREWARRNGHPGDIHSIDDCLNHDIDELFA